VFQKSVALVLSHIMASQNPTDSVAQRGYLYNTGKPSPTPSPNKQTTPDASFWAELGHGHGKQSYLLQKRRSSFNSKADHEDSNALFNNSSTHNLFLRHGEEDNGHASPKVPNENHTVSFPGRRSDRIPIATPSPGLSSLTSALSAGVGLSMVAQSLDSTSSVLRASNDSAGSNWDQNMYSRSAVDLSQMYTGESGNTRVNSSDSSAGPPILAMPHPQHQFINDERVSGYSLTSHPALAMSPAIPIVLPSSSSSASFSTHQFHQPHHPYGYSSSLSSIPPMNQRQAWAQQPAENKIAGSFVESKSSVLNDAEINRRVILEEDEEDESDEEEEEDDEQEEDE
jgi:hypothetical protein